MIEYPFLKDINLHVKGRISAEDAERQTRTAREILFRLGDQPGLILADEVGMGKTFVALAVAVSVAAHDSRGRPVVVMVPPSLKEKWPADYKLFQEKCLSRETSEKLRPGIADNGVDFLKLLDDPPNRKKSILFVTHGAMSRGLNDRWVMAALIRQAIHRRRSAEELRHVIGRVMPDLLRIKKLEQYGFKLWEQLFTTEPTKWLEVLHRWGIDPEFDDDPNTDDDPIPQAICNVLPELDTTKLYEYFVCIPRRKSKHYDQHIREARKILKQEMRRLWETCILYLDLHLPFLILDEAHHLKNPTTRLASLFKAQEAKDDAEEISRGPLGNVFERMLFLTATPFQLGHSELCSVLERFTGIRWEDRTTPSGGLSEYSDQIQKLRTALDSAQEAAITLDTCWGRLRPEDLVVDGERTENIANWWAKALFTNNLTPEAKDAVKFFRRAERRMQSAENLLKPWVIRHLRPRKLSNNTDDIQRRRRVCGQAVIKEEHGGNDQGIIISGESLLPFLLAARATSHAPDSRPVFAEGLASSYEAYLHTRRTSTGQSKIHDLIDSDDEPEKLNDLKDGIGWYLDQLEAIVPQGDPKASASHPKIAATINRVVNLWESGEKVVVFCHYIATGKTLRQSISDAIDQRIRAIAAMRLGLKSSEVPDRLEQIGKRFFDDDSPIRQACENEVLKILERFPDLKEYHKDLVEIVRRNVRTPSFLVRFFPLKQKRLDASTMHRAMNRKDRSGMTLINLLEDFFSFLVDRCGLADRLTYLNAVQRVQTGAYYGSTGSFEHDELQGDTSAKLIPNVRLVNGATRQETRQRLMRTFNTPFFPEVLIASNVMAEGVDLHLNCRYVLHHDLCWNPSTLEQRTGRVDRIGAKVERVGRPINIFIPYIAETQDEKMYRVVMDRERWFSVIMGEEYKVDARTTERIAERIPFPENAAEGLSFRLEV